jgi:hypothetical protein
MRSASLRCSHVDSLLRRGLRSAKFDASKSAMGQWRSVRDSLWELDSRTKCEAYQTKIASVNSSFRATGDVRSLALNAGAAVFHPVKTVCALRAGAGFATGSTAALSHDLFTTAELNSIPTVRGWPSTW